VALRDVSTIFSTASSPVPGHLLASVTAAAIVTRDTQRSGDALKGVVGPRENVLRVRCAYRLVSTRCYSLQFVAAIIRAKSEQIPAPSNPA